MYNMIQKNRENGKKGFTLAELLVVVAIIAVLVAISIPIFTSQLDKAKASTDAANVRAAKAAAVTAYLTDEKTTEATYFYDAANGKVLDASTGIAAYGKSSTDIDGDNATSAPSGKIVQIVIGANGASTTASWVAVGK